MDNKMKMKTKTKMGSNKFRRRDAISFLIYYIDYFLNFYALVSLAFAGAFILNAHLTLWATLAAISHSQTHFRDKCFCYVHPNKSMCDRTILLLLMPPGCFHFTSPKTVRRPPPLHLHRKLCV